ncbi:MAG: 3-dehydroquinate synthase [Planctomycetes bacterium]|nr:3-dehydroquinate synthase [Planctomycetota bacterium]
MHCPTTLLAQVDASVGGKTAVNLTAGKNLAGVFHQPRAVYADVGVLATQSEEEYRSGLGEVLKTALVAGPELLELVEQGAPGLTARDPATLAAIVAACVRAKAAVVAADPLERGPRRALNLGHTFAHAIEHAAGFGRVPHGIAVAVGLGIALRAARELGLLEDRELPGRLGRLMGRLGLPADLAELRSSRLSDMPAALSPKELVRAMRLDKKSRGGAVHLVLARAAGRLDLEVPVDGALIESWLAP